MSGVGGDDARVRRRVRALGAALLTGVVLWGTVTACGTGRPGSPEARGGLLAGTADLRGAAYVVAGGGTTELHVLCQVAIAALEAAGARAADECGKVGAVDVRRSAQETEVDTGWAYLGSPDRDGGDPPVAGGPPTAPPTRPGPDELARADAALGVTRLAPTAFGDVDALVTAPGGGVATVSALLARGPVTVCATLEAAADPTRLPAVLAAYRPAGPVRIADAGAVFAGVATGACTVGEVPGTSGRIPALGLVALDDDRGALTRRPAGRGGVTPVLRTPVLAAHPQVAAVLAAVTSRLDVVTMRELDRQVDLEGRDARDVARRWMLAQGLVARA